MKKKPTMRIAKVRAWDAFAKWYRMKSCKNGYAVCYTCDRSVPYRLIQPGHWMTGHTNTNYINVDYIRPQCFGCNIGGRGEQGIFWERIEEEIGTEEFERLRIHSKDVLKISVDEYLDLEAAYKKKLLSLTAHSK